MTVHMNEVAVSPSMRSRSTWVRHFIAQQPLGAVSFAIILGILVISLFADLIAPYDPISVDFIHMLSPPDAAHWCGTDGFGRDILSRLIYGARTAIIIGLSSSVLGCTLGAAVGAASAYFGGLTDEAMMRLTEIMLSIPMIVAALVVVAVLGKFLVLGIDLNLIMAI